MIKILFAGADSFSLPILEGLLKSPDVEVQAVITKPAKPAGRGMRPQPNPILHAAHRAHLPQLIVSSKGDWPKVNEAINKEKPDCVVVAALGSIIPEKTLSALPDKFINIHPSLLPKYRGPSPIETAILEGETVTGTTLIALTPQMDAGPVIAQQEVKIGSMNATELSESLSKTSLELLLATLKPYLDGTIKLTPQIDSHATYTHIITKQNGKLSPKDNAVTNLLKVRAYNKWPGTFIELGGKQFKIIEAHNEKNVFIIDTIQPEGKKSMSAQEFYNGYKHLLTNIPESVKFNLAKTSHRKKG